MCSVLGKPHSTWNDIRISCKSDDFVTLLVHFDVYTADAKHVEDVRIKYIDGNELWKLDKMDRASTTCGIMARYGQMTWCIMSFMST